MPFVIGVTVHFCSLVVAKPVLPQILRRYCHEWFLSSDFKTFVVFWMLYSLFWVIPRRLNFMCRRFGTLFHLHRWDALTPPMKMELIECSETSAHKIQTPGNHPNKECNDFILFIGCATYIEKCLKRKTWYILCHLLMYRSTTSWYW